MPSVTGLVIKKQSGASSYYATWNFNDTITTTTTSYSGINEGDYVTIKSGSTYYNGVAIPSWVMSDTWKVVQIKGDRAVLGANRSGTHDIQSPINVKSLSGGSGTTTSTTIKNTLDNFTINWYYDTGDNIWFSGSSSTSSEKLATYGPPSNAIRIKISVKPNAKTHKVNNTDVVYWTGTTQSYIYSMAGDPPEKPSTPTVSIEKLKLTASIENISDPRTDQIEFAIYNGNVLTGSTVSTVKTCRASVSKTIIAGGKYRVRCRAINLNRSTKIYGEWSDYSSELTTIPSPVINVQCGADSKTSVKVTWTKSATATSYKVE